MKLFWVQTVTFGCANKISLHVVKSSQKLSYSHEPLIYEEVNLGIVQN